MFCLCLILIKTIKTLLHSLWEQIVLTISDTKVSESSNNYAYKAMLETLLSYDDAYEKSVYAEFPTATYANRGLLERSRHFEGGKKVTLITCQRTDLCQQPR